MPESTCENCDLPVASEKLCTDCARAFDKGYSVALDDVRKILDGAVAELGALAKEPT